MMVLVLGSSQVLPLPSSLKNVACCKCGQKWLKLSSWFINLDPFNKQLVILMFTILKLNSRCEIVLSSMSMKGNIWDFCFNIVKIFVTSFKDDSSFKDGSPRFRTKPVLHFWLNWQWLPSGLRWVDCCRWRPYRPRRCRGCRRCRVCRTGSGVGDQIQGRPEKCDFLFYLSKKFKHGKTKQQS